MTTTIKIQANENILNALLSVAESFNNVNKICDMTDDELLCETGRERREFSEMSDTLLHMECVLREIVGNMAVFVQ